MKRSLALILSLLLVFTALTGCGDKSADSECAAPESADYAAGEMPSQDRMTNASDSKAEAEGLGSSSVTGGFAMPADAKMIYTANLELETLDYEEADRAIGRLVGEMGGYFEQRSMSDRSSGYCRSEYTVRVPAERYEELLNRIGELCHVTYADSSAENITEAYCDTESRLETEKIKLDRLQELLRKADDMQDIILIESAIADTEYAIEELSGTLRHYDARVDYSTVYLSLREVYRLSGTEAAPDSFGERIGSAFVNGLRSAGDLLEDLAVSLAYSWVLVLLAAAAAVILVRSFRRRRNAPRKEKKARGFRSGKAESGEKRSAQEKAEEAKPEE